MVKIIKGQPVLPLAAAPVASGNLAILGHFVKTGAAAQPDRARAVAPDVDNIGVLKFGEFVGVQVR